MKADLRINSTPTVGTTIFKLALLGGVMFAFAYAILAVLANALATLQ